jgi:hypothetical protein
MLAHLTLLCLFNRPALAADRFPWRILPGVSLGKLNLGEEIGNAKMILGKPDLRSPNMDAAMGHQWMVWKSSGNELDVYTVRGAGDSAKTPQNFIRQIRTTSARFHTPDGVRVGVPLGTVRKHVPGLALVKTIAGCQLFDSAKTGIAFEFSKHKCVAIVVHAKNSGVLAQYIHFPAYQRG